METAAWYRWAMSVTYEVLFTLLLIPHSIGVRRLCNCQQMRLNAKWCQIFMTFSS